MTGDVDEGGFAEHLIIFKWSVQAMKFMLFIDVSMYTPFLRQEAAHLYRCELLSFYRTRIVTMGAHGWIKRSVRTKMMPPCAEE